MFSMGVGRPRTLADEMGAGGDCVDGPGLSVAVRRRWRKSQYFLWGSDAVDKRTASHHTYVTYITW